MKENETYLTYEFVDTGKRDEYGYLVHEVIFNEIPKRLNFKNYLKRGKPNNLEMMFKNGVIL